MTTPMDVAFPERLEALDRSQDDAWRYQVYLDGVRLDRCVRADARRGTVTVAKTSLTGVCRNDAPDAERFEERSGSVEIVRMYPLSAHFSAVIAASVREPEAVAAAAKRRIADTLEAGAMPVSSLVAGGTGDAADLREDVPETALLTLSPPVGAVANPEALDARERSSASSLSLDFDNL